MKIGISTSGFGWAGGVELLRHFTNALMAVQPAQKIELHLLLPADHHVGSARDVLTLGVNAFRASVQRRRLVVPRRQTRWHSSLDDFFSALRDRSVQAHVYENSSGGLARCLRRAGIDVVFPMGQSLGARFSTPWVGYIPDFQHRYLTHLFDSRECFDREIIFSSVLRDAPALVVNSRTVREDIGRFYSWMPADRIFALPFAPTALAAWFDELSPSEMSSYQRPARYFIISNQFWAHKDHPTAFHALAKIRQTAEFADVEIICTGTMDDYRNKDYQQQIVAQIESLGLTGCVKLLGHIPKRHQIELMRSSIASVQPTLFEGGPGGGSTYDAVALGVPVILSDIPVNNEVDVAGTQLFTPGDASALAALMAIQLRTPLRRPTVDELMQRTLVRQQLLGETLVSALTAATCYGR